MKGRFGELVIDSNEFGKGVKKQMKKFPEGTTIELGLSNSVLLAARTPDGELEFYYLTIREDEDGNSVVKLKKR